jgi:hypothetical protein
VIMSSCYKKKKKIVRRRYVLLICEEQSDVRNYYFMVDLNRHLSFFCAAVCEFILFLAGFFHFYMQ